MRKRSPSHADIPRLEALSETGDAIQWGGPTSAKPAIPTPDGKAHFHAPRLPATIALAVRFQRSTRRGNQFNTLIYAEVDPLTGASRDAIFMSADDAADHHVRHGDRVALVNEPAV